jgi:hypothetical protein
MLHTIEAGQILALNPVQGFPLSITTSFRTGFSMCSALRSHSFALSLTGQFVT